MAKKKGNPFGKMPMEKGKEKGKEGKMAMPFGKKKKK